MPDLQGGAKVQEASYIFQELGEKYNWTVGAVCKAVLRVGILACCGARTCPPKHRMFEPCPRPPIIQS